MSRGVSQAVTAVRWQASLHRHALGSDPVLVLAPPKVGSRALRQAMLDATGVEPLHAHWVTAQGIRRAQSWWQHAAGVDAPAPIHHRGRYIRYRLALPRRGRWRIVTGVREPMRRLVAEFFQVGGELGWFDELQTAADPDPAELVDRFVAWVGQAPSTADWYREELETVTGIDMYARPFPTDRGFDTFENPKCRVLLVRNEDLRRVGPEATAAFLDTSGPVDLPETNVGAAKQYAPLYSRFLQHAELPAALLDAVYEQPAARHFYTASERSSFRADWIGGTRADA